MFIEGRKGCGQAVDLWPTSCANEHASLRGRELYGKLCFARARRLEYGKRLCIYYVAVLVRVDILVELGDEACQGSQSGSTKGASKVVSNLIARH